MHINRVVFPVIATLLCLVLYFFILHAWELAYCKLLLAIVTVLTVYFLHSNLALQ